MNGRGARGMLDHGSASRDYRQAPAKPRLSLSTVDSEPMPSLDSESSERDQAGEHARLSAERRVTA